MTPGVLNWGFVRPGASARRTRSYPLAAQASIDAWELAEHLIPVDLGGRLRTTEELLALVRVVARRDLTVAVSFGANLLAALPSGSLGRLRNGIPLAEILRSCRGLALAVTERGSWQRPARQRIRAIPSTRGFGSAGRSG